MSEATAAARTTIGALSDEEVIRRVRAGEPELFEILMRRYNQRLYRVARSIVKNEPEAEDVMQQAYVNAYTHLGQFADRARFSTWLTRIAVYEALGRLRRRRRVREVDVDSETEGERAPHWRPGSRAPSGRCSPASCGGCSRKPSTRCRARRARLSSCGRWRASRLPTPPRASASAKTW